MLKQQHQLFVGLLAAADAGVIVAASFAAWGLRRALLGPHWEFAHLVEYPKDALVLFSVPLTLLSLRSFGLYKARRDRALLSEMAQVFKACAAAMLAILAALYVLDLKAIFQPGAGTVPFLGVQLDSGRLQLGALTLLLPVLLSLHRVSFRALLRVVRQRGWNLRHVAIIGVGRLGQIVGHTLERNTWTGIKVSYFIAHTAKPGRAECMGRPIRGGLEDLEVLMSADKPDAVYVAMPGAYAEQTARVLARLEKYPVDVRIVPDISPRFVPQSMSVSELDGMPILSYRESPTTGFGGLSKRGLDIVGAAIALVVFSPVMLLIAILVRISGPGPVIFKQRRVSLGGEVFDIYKFRTMFHADDETLAGSVAEIRSGTEAWTQPRDPRITRIGRWLRRTSLDELPQLLNVLTGEMSLVGPRPERPELIERFREDWRGYMLRQHVKAGMTGWAQINGHRGSSSLRKRLQYDLFYVKNWSLGFDLKILLLTVVRGFVHRNAH